MRLSLTLFIAAAVLCLLPGSVLSQTLLSSGTAQLTGQQRVRPIASPGSGEIAITIEEINSDDVRVVVTGSFMDLSSPLATDQQGGAHLHLGYSGRNGEIVQPLKVTAGEDDRSGTFTADDNTFVLQRTEFREIGFGEIYVDLHTTRYPTGELRGNIVSGDREAYYANLYGSNVVPDVSSNAYGALLLEFSPDDNSLRVSGSYTGLSNTVANTTDGVGYLRLGRAGETGPDLFKLTASFDNGDGDNDNDDGNDDDGARNRAVYTVTDNSFTLTEDQVAALRSGRIYGVVTSGAFNDGEIRGQLLPSANILFRAKLAGANEYPPVSSNGSGEVIAQLNGNTLRLFGNVSDLDSPIATSIMGGAHLHAGYAGRNGEILFPITLDPSEDGTSAVIEGVDNEITLTDAQRELMVNRGIYVNVHTEAHPSGEVRGQVLAENQAVYTAFLTGNQHIPSVTTTGHGMLKIELSEGEMIVSGSYDDLSSELNVAAGGGAHLHVGYPGQSGPVVYSLTVTDTTGDSRGGLFLPDANTFPLPDGADTLQRRFLYANIHSLDHPSGEIRGQVLAQAERYFYAPLSGASQPDGVPTESTGMIAAEVTDSVVTMVGSFQDLSSDFATQIAGGMHLHRGLAGSNGEVIYRINTEEEDDRRNAVILADSNRVVLSPSLLDSMLQRAIYANVHSANYPAGEIRGQLLPAATSYFHTTLSGYNETNAVITTAQGGLKLELNDSNLVVTGSVTMLEGTFDFNPAGGAHLHLAPAGQNGGVVLPLSGDTLMAGAAVEFVADSNRYVLADSLVTALRDGRLYANIHTTEVRSGEARGQIRGELNLFPDSSMIVSPMDGDSLTLEGSNQQEFRVSYMPTTDPDGDTVIYVWQLAMDEDFDTILFAANTGRDTFFSTNFGTVDVLLDSFGVDTNATTTLYHRVLASDGSNFTPSEGASITLTRDSIVSNRNFLPKGFAGRTFPNPATSNAALTYELTTREAFSGRLLLYNQLGQLRQNLVINARPGTQQITLNSADLSAGYYFLTLRHDDGRMIQVTRIAVR